MWRAWSICGHGLAGDRSGRALGWEATEPTPRHAIIVTQTGGKATGLIVDSVSDIVTIPKDTLQPPPVTANDRSSPFWKGWRPSTNRW
jgi:chemotaxis signal transduction protein